MADTVADTVFDISGMHCASCVGRVERALEALPGVAGASVNLLRQEAVVQGAIDAGAVATAISQAGYPAKLRPDGADHAAQTAKRDAEIAHLRRQTLIAGLLTLPVFLAEMGGHIVPALHHFIASTVGLSTSWAVQAVLITLVMAWPGRGFYINGAAAIRRFAPDMNALVAIGTLAAWAYSMLALFVPQIFPQGTVAVYFEAAGVIITLVLLGRYLEARAKGRTGEAIAQLLRLGAKTALVMRGEDWVEIDASEIQRGDILRLRPGDIVPADGHVQEGQSHVDESMMTGEAMPVEKAPGDTVIGGTINTTGALTLRATAVGAASTLAQIIRMVEQATAARLPVQDLVNRVTMWFVPGVLICAALTVVAWLAFGPDPVLRYALVAGVSVLIVACPCAMGLATPVSIMVGAGRAAQLGVLFRKGDALQTLQSVRTLVFDKTGTLTTGKPVVTDIMCAKGVEQNEILALASGVEAASEHPIATAIVAHARMGGLSIPKAKDFKAIVGHGARAQVEGRAVEVGAARMFAALPFGFQAQADDWAAQGKTPVFVALDGAVVALIAVADTLKDTTAQVLQTLRAQGFQLAMITGDTHKTAAFIAGQLDLDQVIAEALPGDKAAALDGLARPLAFVGDGINDAPALASADVGIAVGTGTDIAIQSADVVLMAGDLRGVANAMKISQHTMRNIGQNLFWAFGYNVLLIPVAAGVLFPFTGLLLSPALAAGAMGLSSVLVLTNALRLRWVQAI